MNKLEEESCEIAQVYPDRITKTIAGEPLTFYATVKIPSNTNREEFINNFIIELWTNITSKEFQNNENNQLHDYAAKFKVNKIDKDYILFQRTITPTQAGFYKFSVRYRSKTDHTWQWYQNTTYENRIKTEIQVQPSWLHDTVVYNAFVRHFGAEDKNNDGVIEPGEGGTFQDLIDKMYHFRHLGIKAIYLNPIQSTNDIHPYHDDVIKYDKYNILPEHMQPGSVYSVKDYKSIDPELGLNKNHPETSQYEEFKHFVKVCHKNNMRVIMDITFNHTSKDSFLQRIHPEWFLYKEQPDNLEGDFIGPEHPDAKKYWGKRDHVFSPFDHGLHWTDCAQLNWNYYFWDEVRNKNPPKNHRINEMIEYFKNMLKYWIKYYGVDGFRLDVSYMIPTDFYRDSLEECRSYAKMICKSHSNNPDKQPLAPLNPDILFTAESYVCDLDKLQECGISSVGGDFSMKIFNVAQLKGYLDYIYNKSGDFFPNGSTWWLYPECHDFNRLPKKFGNLENNSSDLNLNKSRWVLTALLPGIPMLHNGYEVVEHDNVSVRTYSQINWNSEKNITDFISKINNIRNKYIAFQKGDYTFVNSEQGITEHAQLFSFIRDYKGKDRQTCLVVVNMDFNNKADHVQIDLPYIDGYNFNRPFLLKDLITGNIYERKDPFITIVLEPGDCHVFEIVQN